MGSFRRGVFTSSDFDVRVGEFDSLLQLHEGVFVASSATVKDFHRPFAMLCSCCVLITFDFEVFILSGERWINYSLSYFSVGLVLGGFVCLLILSEVTFVNVICRDRCDKHGNNNPNVRRSWSLFSLSRLGLSLTTLLGGFFYFVSLSRPLNLWSSILIRLDTLVRFCRSSRHFTLILK